MSTDKVGKIDKDDPRTWVKHKDSLCRNCYGTCCTMPVEIKIEDIIRLGLATEDEAQDSTRKLASRLKKEGIIQSYRENTKMFMLTQRPNGDCLYLGEKTRLCAVYEKRPNTCRLFPKIGLRPGFCPAKPK